MEISLILSTHYTVLALVIVPVISVAVRRFGRFLRELSHQTQAAAAVASSIAEVICIPEHLLACNLLMGMCGGFLEPFWLSIVSLSQKKSNLVFSLLIASI